MALDFQSLGHAVRMARSLSGLAGLFKIGSQLFTAHGPAAVRRIHRLRNGIFLDLKFHDIPNTVFGAVSSAAELRGVRLINVHAVGGLEMMRAAARGVVASHPARTGRPKVIGVTVLTSLSAREVRQVGLKGTPGHRALQLAALAQKAGLDGVVASPHEVRAIRRACGNNFLIVVPGVRSAERGLRVGGAMRGDDQARAGTAWEAVANGADYVVVGRPIIAAPNPRAAALAVQAEISSAERARV